MIEEIMRMSERLIIACGGILAIWLGYQLFRISEIKTDSGGSFKSALFNMTLTKVGPGVFFALFGAYVLATGLTKPVQIQSPSGITAEQFIAYTVGIREELAKLPDSPEKAKLMSLVEKIPTGRATPDRPPGTLFYGIFKPETLTPEQLDRLPPDIRDKLNQKMG